MSIKKKVDIVITETKQETIEIFLPRYREQMLDSCTVYTRINENLSAIHIWRYHSEQRFEIILDERYNFDSSDLDYHLGRGMYSSSKNKFDSVLSEVNEFVKEILDESK